MSSNAAVSYPNDYYENFFNQPLSERDPELYGSITDELARQQDQIELIASENIVSRAVMEAQGGIMTNKYAEGYPGRRYYGGCEFVDVAESLAIERAKKLFDCSFINVQPHSGAQANGAVFMALLQPGDTILGMSARCRRAPHSRRASRTQSGKWFNAVQYGVRREDEQLVDYDQLERARERAQAEDDHLPAARPIPRIARLRQRMREIADSVGAYLLVDMAHFAGLVAPRRALPLAASRIADIVATTTTHKTLRGPRGGMILTERRRRSAKKFNSGDLPGASRAAR